MEEDIEDSKIEIGIDEYGNPVYCLTALGHIASHAKEFGEDFFKTLKNEDGSDEYVLSPLAFSLYRQIKEGKTFEQALTDIRESN